MKNQRVLQRLFSFVIWTIIEVLAQEFAIPYTFQYGKALDLSPFRILVGLSLDNCRAECKGRLKCLSFNFKATICELNDERETASIALKDRPGSVYQEKPPGPTPNFLQCGTSMCGINEVCDYKTSSCSIKECEPFLPPQNGEVLGNDYAVGRTMRTGCKNGFLSSTGSLALQKSTCLVNGTWDVTPFQCIAPQIIQQWVSTVTGYSTQYDTDTKSAAQVIGAPNIYPNYGDDSKAWAPSTLDANQFIEIQFTESVQVINVTIYETFNAGGVKAVKAKHGSGYWVTLWSTPTVQHITTERMFTPPLSVFPTPTRDFRIEFDCTASGNVVVEIDAVKLVGTRVAYFK